MGLQITVLLSDIIYVDILQSTVPVFDSFGNSPLILRVVFSWFEILESLLSKRNLYDVHFLVQSPTVTGFNHLQNHMKFFHCLHSDVDNLLARNEPKISPNLVHSFYFAYYMLHFVCNLHLSGRRSPMAPFKFQLTRCLFIIARRMRHETFLDQKLDSVEVSPRMVFILAEFI